MVRRAPSSEPGAETPRDVTHMNTARWQQPWGLELQAINYDIMMTSWKEKFNSQRRGYQLLLYSKTCHCVHEQWAESIISTGFYGHHKFGTLRPHPPPRVSPSPSVSSCNAPPDPSTTNPILGKIKAAEVWGEITQVWLWGDQVSVSSARGFPHCWADTAGWTDPLTLALPLKAILKSVLMSTPRQMLQEDLLVQAAHLTPYKGTYQSILIKD